MAQPTGPTVVLDVPARSPATGAALSSSATSLESRVAMVALRSVGSGGYQSTGTVALPPPAPPQPAVGVSTQQVADQFVHSYAGGEARYQTLSPKKQREIRTGVDMSVQPRARPVVAHIAEDNYTAEVSYEMLHNSPFNGKKIRTRSGGIGTIADAITSSNLPRANVLTMARCMKLNGEVVAYSGRPNTEAKFTELAQMVYANQAVQGDQLTLVMHSLLSTYPFSPDAQYLAGERKFLRRRDADGNITLTLKDKNNQEKRVKCRIIFFNQQFNYSNRLEEALPESLSGAREAKRISDDLARLRSAVGPTSDRLVLRAFELLSSPDSLKAEEKLFLHILICQRANLPLVLHCKSCIDRTGIAAMLAFALKEWQAMGKEIPLRRPYELLDKPEFKELFWQNIGPAHLMTHWSRRDWGFKWEVNSLAGLTQHPTLLRLIPERYLTSFAFGNPECKITAKTAFLFGGLLMLRSPADTLKWLGAGDVSGVKQAAMIPLRTLALLLAISWTIVEMALLFAVGTLAAPFLTILQEDEKLCPLGLLGLQLVYAFIHIVPDRVVKEGVTVTHEENDGSEVPRPLFFQRSIPKHAQKLGI